MVVCHVDHVEIVLAVLVVGIAKIVIFWFCSRCANSRALIDPQRFCQELCMSEICFPANTLLVNADDAVEDACLSALARLQPEPRAFAQFEGLLEAVLIPGQIASTTKTLPQ